MTTRFKTFIAVAVAIGLLLAGLGIAKIESQQHQIQAQARTLHSLVVNNQQALQDQGQTVVASANARVITVTQRCQLTNLILQVVVKDDHKRAAPFEKSYAGCEKQLVEVKAIAAKAKGKDSPGGI